MENYTCPCCGYKTFESKQEFDICPICFWEDDNIQFDKVDMAGGANVISLRQAQQNYIKYCVSQQRFLKYVRKPKKDEKRDENWKPL